MSDSKEYDTRRVLADEYEGGCRNEVYVDGQWLPYYIEDGSERGVREKNQKEILAEIRSMREDVNNFRDGLKKELGAAIDSRTVTQRSYIDLHLRLQKWVREILSKSGVTPVEPEEKP